MTITNGTVEYTTPRPFDAASARVILSFDFAVGEDVEVIIMSVGELARRRAIALISAPVSNLEKAKAPVDQVMTGGPVAPPAVVLGPVPNGTVWAGPAAGKPVGNVVDIMGGSVAPNPTATAALPAAAAAQPEAPAPVSDQRLLDEVGIKNTALINAAGADDVARQLATQRIVKLTDKYTGLPPGPGRLQKIPQDRRLDFLKELEALP